MKKRGLSLLMVVMAIAVLAVGCGANKKGYKKTECALCGEVKSCKLYSTLAEEKVRYCDDCYEEFAELMEDEDF